MATYWPENPLCACWVGTNNYPGSQCPIHGHPVDPPDYFDGFPDRAPARHPKEGDFVFKCAWGAILGAFAGLALNLVLPARAHDYKRPDLDNWYSGLHRPGAPYPCCSRQDCHTTEAEIRNGVWWARIGKPIDHGEHRDWELGDYVRIPDELIVRDERGMPVQNPEGEAVICHDTSWVGGQTSVIGTTVFCFVPGTES